MANLFDDSFGGGKSKPVRKISFKRKKKKSNDISSKILEKIQGRANLVDMSSGDSNLSVDFTTIDISPLRKKKIKKVDDGVIVPLINYVEDI